MTLPTLRPARIAPASRDRPGHASDPATLGYEPAAASRVRRMSSAARGRKWRRALTGQVARERKMDVKESPGRAFRLADPVGARGVDVPAPAT